MHTPALIDVNQCMPTRIPHALRKPLTQLVAHGLAIDRINTLYRDVRAETSGDCFFQRCLNWLQIEVHIDADRSARIPCTGPVVVVANHPFGGLDGIAMGALLSSIRPEYRILGNFLLHAIPDIRERIIPADPFAGEHAAGRNIGTLRACLKWLQGGGILGCFPAGEVSHIGKRGQITDPPWSPHIASLVRRSKATVVPIYFCGRNSALFNMAGLVHPRLRTALLGRELMRGTNQTIRMHIGAPIPWTRLRSFSHDNTIIDFLRLHAYLLAERDARHTRWSPLSRRRRNIQTAPIAPPSDTALLERELTRLPVDRCLIRQGDFSVWCAPGHMIPALLREIGIQREKTFRSVGEGTGKPVDLDQFDPHYDHLFLWDHTQRTLAGAYRIGYTDRDGRQQFYCKTLFKFSPRFLRSLGPALELGRSFINASYQKQYSALGLLWRGIGSVVAHNPQYRTLFGPVSITNDYQPMSKRLLVHFLKDTRCNPQLARMVKPRRPPRQRPPGHFARRILTSDAVTFDHISALIAEIEADGKGAPILLKQYLRLNGTILTFNVDRRFNNALDGLLVVDLMQSDSRLLARFMGSDGYTTFCSYHRAHSTGSCAA